MREYSIRQLTPAIGAEISGIDLSDDLSNEQLNQIYDDLIRYNVIFFRNQEIDQQEQINLSKCLAHLKHMLIQKV